MSSVNKATLLGHLGKDPEVRTMNNGDKAVSFSLATSTPWKDKQTGEKREKTEWHNVVIWNQGIAKVAEQYLRKGSKVYLEGQIQTRKWQDRDGKDRWTTEIVLPAFRGDLTLLDSQSSRPPPPSGPDDYGTQRSAGAPGSSSAGASNTIDDDIPF